MGWTRFMDMHSGGDLKLPPYTHIYIESDSRAKGVSIFQEKFGLHPEHITCPCCGKDYSISFGEDLAQLTGFERGCAYARCAHRSTGGWVVKRFLRWLFAKPAPPDLAPTVRSGSGMSVEITGREFLGDAGPQPGPVADRDGRANWSAFWSEAKRLGFDAKAVRALAGTKSLAHLEPEAVEDLLNVMRDREGYARPAGDEKCVALTASWCGTEQRNAKRPPHGSGMNVTSRPCTPEEIEELVALHRKLSGESKWP